MELFGDALTEALIRQDGDEGLTRTITAEFLAPVRCGDYLEVRAKLLSIGKSSRQFECSAYRVIQLVDPDDSAADILAEPVLVARASGVAVVPVPKQRNAPK
jgi:3-aminobutyryl-CoA ammonia-lyase